MDQRRGPVQEEDGRGRGRGQEGGDRGLGWVFEVVNDENMQYEIPGNFGRERYRCFLWE